MNPQTSTPVLIIGAGPAGLSLAAELLRHGMACRIIDRELVASPFSRALAVHARTLEFMENLGIADRFVEKGLQLSAFNVFERRKHLVRMSFRELDSRYPYVLSIPQSETERILAEHHISQGGVIERGVTLAGFAQDSMGVTAQLDHADGRKEEVRCAWLAGCDGAHSTVRHGLEMPFLGEKYPQYYVLADVEFETTLDITEFYIFSDGDRLAGFHTFSDKGARIFADIDLAESEREHPQVTLEQLQAQLDERGPGTVRLTKLNWLSTFFCHVRQVPSYRDGRVFLAGDAAHVHSPAGGQGMNLGIQDAFNLAWKLACVVRGDSPESLLDSYSPERHRVGKEILRMTDFFQRINTERNPVLQFFRGTVGPWLSRRSIIRQRYRRAVAELSQCYRRSPVIDGPAPPWRTAPRPGERAPDGHLFDPRGNEAVRLFEILSAPVHHALLFTGRAGTETFATSLEFLEESYAGRVAPVVVCPASVPAPECFYEDRDLLLHRQYGIVAPAIVLVRPDGHIAFISRPAKPEALRAYLEKIFLPK